jgi:UDP-galactopyranose mutase
MKIAVLGGGPAGCAAAHFLRARGLEDVTIYEQSELGGCAHTRVFEGIPYEFGPQVMFTDREDLRRIFERFLPYHPPPNPERRYRYLCSVDGSLDDPHDFPLTLANVLKAARPLDVIDELYRLELSRPDHENFERYCISRVGRTLYETYIKNYNAKAWRMDPAEMDTEWVHFRPLTLQRSASRFGDQWQGHPGDYNPMWAEMARGARLVRGRVDVVGDLDYRYDGAPIDADVVVTTLTPSPRLEHVNTCLVFVALRSEQTVLPAAFVTFPNHYDFVRAFEYRQQFAVDSAYTLLSFDCPWRGVLDRDRFVGQALDFCRHVLRREIAEWWVESRERIYPLSTSANLGTLRAVLDMSVERPVIPIGRAGLHAYASKDTVIRMGRDVAEHWDELLDPRRKSARLQAMRRDLH